MDKDLVKISEKIGHIMHNKSLKLAVAESCTGGLVAAYVTSIPGSSSYFDRGFVTYSNEAKMEMLNVRTVTLGNYGAVSEKTAIEMAEGALKNSRAEVTLAVTGIAGPTGGTEQKPVGMICFAWKIKGKDTISATKYFQGNRESIQLQATEFVLTQLLQYL